MRSERILATIDAHAGGQQLRILTHGLPRLRGATMRERLTDLRTNYDHIRRELLFEPRGHANLTGAILLRPVANDADYGVIFMTTSGYGGLSGHGIIALTTALIETGAVPIDGPDVRVTYETVVGTVQARASVDQGRVLAVRFRNVPAFRLQKDLEIVIDDQPIQVDVAFGGAWYAIVPAASLGLEVKPTHVPDLIRVGMAVRREVSNALDIVHPEDDFLAGLYGTVITGPPATDETSVVSATIYADGAMDRSPCGTGTAAQVACLAANGELGIGDMFANESMIGSVFSGRIVMSGTVGGHPSVITEVSGRGAITGMNQFFFDPGDPYREGFLIR